MANISVRRLSQSVLSHCIYQVLGIGQDDRENTRSRASLPVVCTHSGGSNTSYRRGRRRVPTVVVGKHARFAFASRF